MSQSQWSHIMNAEEIAAYHALLDSIDPGFSVRERELYESRTSNSLRAMMKGAWDANDPTGYQVSRYYLSLIENKES